MKRKLLATVGLTCAAILIAAAAPAPQPSLLWDCEAPGQTGLEPETALVKQGQAAVRWRHHPQTPSFDVPGVPADWTGYNQLRLWLHNAKAVPTRFMIIVHSENPQTEGADYWGFEIGLQAVGWRELILPLDGQSAARQPLGWQQVTGITFTASGWGNTPHPEADVVIDGLTLTYEAPKPGPRMTDQEFFDSLDLSRDDLAAVRAAVQAGDLERAKAAFLDHLRQRTSPRWWFDWRDRPKAAAVTGGSPGWDYFGTGFNVDWIGWKQIVLPLKEWGRSREPIGWDHIDYLGLSASYGDRTPDPETTLVLDAIELAGPKPVTISDFETAAEAQAWGGLQLTTDQVKQGDGAALWSSLRQRANLKTTAIPTDWTGFEALRLWVWSAKATGDRITVIADSDTPDLGGAEQVMRHLHGGFHLGDDIDWQANKLPPTDPSFTREWTYSLNRFSDWITLGNAYWASGDERYAREWIAQMHDWVEDNPYPIHGTGNNTLTWRTIEAGIRTSGSWPETFYRFLGSPSLTPDDAVTFLKSWIEHAHHLMRITVEHPEHGGNWVTMECNGLGHLGILLPEGKDAPLWLKTAVDRLTLELDRQVYPDGAQKELTTGYHQVARMNFVELYKFAKLNGIELPAAYLSQLERLYDYDLKAMTPDGCLPPLNDAGYTQVLAAMAEGAELFDRDDFRWAASGGTEGQGPDYTSLAFPYAGQYVMRSGWGTDDKYLLFESGPFGIGHQHEDKLSLFAYGLGRVLLTEAGTYSYDQSTFRRYVLSTWAHNTILVDGQGQHRGGLPETYQTDRPLDNLWLHNDAFDAADGVYDNGYGAKRDIQVVHERTVVFLRADYWVVLDRLHGEGDHRYDILWHLNADAAQSDPATKAAWGTDAGVANLLVTPGDATGLELEIVVGRTDPVLGFAPARSKKPVPVLDYRRAATGPATMVWVLTPFQGEHPAVSATAAERDGGTVITVRRPGGTDWVYVAQRGETHPVTMGGKEGTGQVVVVRSPAP